LLRPRPTILVKLLIAFAAPTLALFALFAYVAWDVARRDLDAELGTRMTAIAASAASQLGGAKYLVKLEAGNEQDTRRVQLQGRLAELERATGAKLAVFDREFRSRLDTDAAVEIGAEYFRFELDRVEIGRVFDEGAPVASEVTFEGDDGRRYKAGYAPMRGDGDEVVLVVAAQAPAGYFARLDEMRASLFWWGAGLAVVVLLASVLVTVLITRPVRLLAGAAERIGRGDLDAPVAVRARDELGVLAGTMERMRAQLRERDARMQQMLAGIAHEVRNPLAGMTLFTGILREEVTEEQRAHVDKIARELGYLERVVQEFLDFARRPPPEKTDLDARDLLEEVAQVVSTDTVELAVDADLTIHGDRAQLHRALLNLARNAVQYAEPGSTVRLRAVRHGDEVHLEVTNRGPTIPTDRIDKIFEPFFTTREKGTGLGLAFVREIAQDHGGRVDVTSADGETRFRVMLPGT
jgi:signal transduction histidine kinase